MDFAFKFYKSPYSSSGRIFTLIHEQGLTSNVLIILNPSKILLFLIYKDNGMQNYKYYHSLYYLNSGIPTTFWASGNLWNFDTECWVQPQKGQCRRKTHIPTYKPQRKPKYRGDKRLTENTLGKRGEGENKTNTMMAAATDTMLF